MVLTFPLSAGYDNSRMTVNIRAEDESGNGVLVRVSEKALDDHFGSDEPLSQYDAQREVIQAAAERKYEAGEREPDNSILIESGDL